jgi:hypothetical protein
MRTNVAALLAIVCLSILASSAWAAPVQQAPSPAAPLFEQALRADAEGLPDRRVELLHQALQLDPDFELARWHLGQILFQGKWRSIESVGRLVSHGHRWREYRQHAASLGTSPEAHADLARWCHGQRLESEEKWHWQQVLQANAHHREALGRLGLKHYQGGLYTDEQVTDLQERRDQAVKGFNRYQKSLKRLLGVAKHGNEAERSEALADIAATNDPAAIGALMDLLVKTSKVEKDKEFALRVCHSVVAALSNLSEHEATEKLLEIAVLAPHKQVRRDAARGLSYREPTSFVPQLMANLSAPVESTYAVSVLPSGHVTLLEDFHEEGPMATRKHVRSTSYVSLRRVNSRNVSRIDPATGKRLPRDPTADLVADPASDLRRAQGRVAKTNQQLAAESRQKTNGNTRIQEALEIATKLPVSSDPVALWNSWKQYNELYTPEELPVYETYDEERYFRSPPTTSCFVAGTPVWTQSGPRPIEQISVGEIVLSQDPISGRLDFRPVVGTTIRPPSGVVKLALRGETITATRGHRFWVAGHGWQMAKFLETGHALFGCGGSVELRDVAPGEEEVAYNLVVADFHTYFVGRNRLLVHDNNCPQPTTAIIPGSETLGSR